MSNELIVIEEGTALAVLSSVDGVEKLIADVRKRVMSLEGGSMETITGRKTIRSNAFKATKAKTALNKEYIQPLIDNINKEIQPSLDKIQALKDSKKTLDAGLDNIRSEINAEVDKLEAEIKAKADAIKTEEEAAELAKQLEADHELAHLVNEKFDRDAADKLEAARRAEDERQIKLKADQKARDKQIAEEAAAKATADAEAATRRAVDAELLVKQQAKAAVEATRLAKKKAADDKRAAELKAIEAQKQAVINAENAAENARLEMIEQRRIEDVAAAEQQAKREANKKHIGAIRKQAKETIMALGIDEATAKKLVLAISNNEIANVIINY